jgi:hypothetical protein
VYLGEQPVQLPLILLDLVEGVAHVGIVRLAMR